MCTRTLLRVRVCTRPVAWMCLPSTCVWMCVHLCMYPVYSCVRTLWRACVCTPVGTYLRSVCTVYVCYGRYAHRVRTLWRVGACTPVCVHPCMPVYAGVRPYMQVYAHRVRTLQRVSACTPVYARVSLCTLHPCTYPAASRCVYACVRLCTSVYVRVRPPCTYPAASRCVHAYACVLVYARVRPPCTIPCGE